MHAIKLTLDEVDVLVAKYQREIEDQNALIAQANDRIESAMARIRALTEGEIFQDNRPAPPRMLKPTPFGALTLAGKARRVLNAYTMIATTRKIAELIKETEGGEYTEADLSTVVNNLSATLKQKIDKAEIFQRVEIGGEFFYGIKGWFDDAGAPKEERLSRLAKKRIMELKNK